MARRGPPLLDPAAEDRGRGAEEEDGDAEDPAQIRELPIIRRRLGDADQLRHREVEYAEGVGLADAQMHAKGGRRHHPPAETWPGDGVLAIEKGQQAHDVFPLKLPVPFPEDSDFGCSG